MLQYPPSIAILLAEARLNPLGPGAPNESARAGLEALQVDSTFAPHVVTDRNMAACCLAGLWLYHDFLDRSHSLSQDIDTREGSYWHAIMHRREPDAWNSKYWWRRVGNHPVFTQLADAAAQLGWRAWDAAAFVDECERERGRGSPRELLLREVQQTEWELLFDWCFARAI